MATAVCSRCGVWVAGRWVAMMGRCTNRRVTVVWHENLFPARRYDVANVDMIVDVVGQNVVGAIVLQNGGNETQSESRAIRRM